MVLVECREGALEVSYRSRLAKGRSGTGILFADPRYFDTEDGEITRKSLCEKLSDSYLEILAQNELTEKPDPKAARSAKQRSFRPAAEEYRAPIGTEASLRETIAGLPDDRRMDILAKVLGEYDFPWETLVERIPKADTRVQAIGKLLAMLGMTERAVSALITHVKFVSGLPSDIQDSMDEAAQMEAITQGTSMARQVLLSPAKIAAMSAPEAAKVATDLVKLKLLILGQPTEIVREEVSVLNERWAALQQEFSRRGVALKDISPKQIEH
jgi:hypothetical protein